jgi:hypothetical protein
MARMEIITGLEPRRSWSEKQKRAVVDAGVVPGRSIGAAGAAPRR